MYTLSVDKKYNKTASYINDFVKENMQDYVINKYNSKDRIYYEFESKEFEFELYHCFRKLVKNCFLVFMKLEYFLKNKEFKNLTHSKCMLLCFLIYFDRKYENDLVSSEIFRKRNINIDGIMNFRLKELKENWNELVLGSIRLLDSSCCDEDVFDMADFFKQNESKGKNKLSFVNNKLFNNTYDEFVEVLNLFDNKDYNLISAIIKECPKKTDFSNAELSKDLIGIIKYLNNGNKNNKNGKTIPLEKGGNIIRYDFINKKEIK